MHFRSLWILSRLLLQVLYGVAMVLCVWPWARASLRARTEKHWARGVLKILRIGVQVEFEVPEADYAKFGPVLIYSNHVSWLDVFVFNAHCPLTFVAKSEIAKWPVAGFLARRSGTVFIERGRKQAVRGVVEQCVRVLRDGRSVAIFPEGTTTGGATPLPFHSNLTYTAVLAGVPLLPVSLSYCTPQGEFTAEPAFVGDQTLVQNMQVLLKSKQGYLVKTYFHAPIATNQALTRRALSERARDVIAARCEEVAGANPDLKSVAA